jgi:hypothetical protein
MIAERPPELLHKADERGVGDKRPGPKTLVQLALSHDARRLGEKEREQIEGLGCQVDLARITGERPLVGIEGEHAETRDHLQTPEFPLNHSRSAPDS